MKLIRIILKSCLIFQFIDIFFNMFFDCVSILIFNKIECFDIMIYGVPIPAAYFVALLIIFGIFIHVIFSIFVHDFDPYIGNDSVIE